MKGRDKSVARKQKAKERSYSRAAYKNKICRRCEMQHEEKEEITQIEPRVETLSIWEQVRRWLGV